MKMVNIIAPTIMDTFSFNTATIEGAIQLHKENTPYMIDKDM